MLPPSSDYGFPESIGDITNTSRPIIVNGVVVIGNLDRVPSSVRPAGASLRLELTATKIAPTICNDSCGMDVDMLESHDSSDGDLGAELNDTASVSCPYCGETNELRVDLTGGGLQEYVQDCEVCCHPGFVRVQLGGEGYASVSVTTLDDE
jgi:hypothetical protein